MRLRLKGHSVSRKDLQNITKLTDHAKVRTSKLTCDLEKGVVILPLLRGGIIKAPGCGAFVSRYISNPKGWTRSVVVIRNVIGCKVENRIRDACDDEITILFGLSIRGRHVYFESLEENMGYNLYTMDLEVSEIDIEISDTDEP